MNECISITNSLVNVNTVMADCANQQHSSTNDWTGLQHHFRYAIMIQQYFNYGKSGDWSRWSLI